ncbi:DUF998 domain-containing protein [Pseudonocardia lacus]|uniref:DUF998 domain-containing protein n=1 Tax=Pseudonocardia lacus TaxID=2835865 RepID=UPI001BDD1F70|nr:DUF998 domain-containing protein [Pseudonocardia lacus]
MTDRVLPTRALLACGVVAGPVYVAVALAQALTRDGFDLARHRFTALTAGDLGWVHRADMLLVGALTMLFAVGAARVLRPGRGATWGPRLLGLFGAAYVVGGALTADPAAGFPPGAAPAMATATWQGAVQNASRGVSTVLLVATIVVLAAHSAATGRRGWAWFHGLYACAVPVTFAAALAVGAAAGGYPYAIAVVFLVAPWIWVSVLAAHLWRRAGARTGADAVGDLRFAG